MKTTIMFIVGVLTLALSPLSALAQTTTYIPGLGFAEDVEGLGIARVTLVASTGPTFDVNRRLGYYHLDLRIKAENGDIIIGNAQGEQALTPWNGFSGFVNGSQVTSADIGVIASYATPSAGVIMNPSGYPGSFMIMENNEVIIPIILEFNTYGFPEGSTFGIRIDFVRWTGIHRFDSVLGPDFYGIERNLFGPEWVLGDAPMAMPASIPEPSTYALLFGGLAIGLAAYARNRRTATAP